MEQIERNGLVGHFGICRASDMQRSSMVCASKVSHLFSLNLKQ